MCRNQVDDDVGLARGKAIKVVFHHRSIVDFETAAGTWKHCDRITGAAKTADDLPTRSTSLDRAVEMFRFDRNHTIRLYKTFQALSHWVRRVNDGHFDEALRSRPGNLDRACGLTFWRAGPVNRDDDSHVAGQITGNFTQSDPGLVGTGSPRRGSLAGIEDIDETDVSHKAAEHRQARGPLIRPQRFATPFDGHAQSRRLRRTKLR